MNDGDRYVWQPQIRVYRLDGRIAPGPELAEIDVCKHLSCEMDLARFDALDIDDWNDAPDHDRELHHAEYLQFSRVKRHVSCPKIDGRFLD